MNQRQGKIVSLVVAVIVMVVLIIIAVIVNRPQKKQTKRSAVTTTEVSTEKKQTEETTEEEQMTEAPKDTSDWEMQPAENTEPDTGEKIKSDFMRKIVWRCSHVLKKSWLIQRLQRQARVYF